MKKYYWTLVIIILFGTQACDIEEEIFDEALGEDLFETASAENLMAPAYNSLRQVYGHRVYFALQEYTSDEAILPTRQNDWFDGGTFQELHRHDWPPIHAYTVDTWNKLNTGIANASQAIAFLADGTSEKAEMIGLLSYYMYLTLDLFNQVPYRGVADINFNVPSQVLSGLEAMEVILENLEMAMPDLPTGRNSVRFTQDAANALMARMYLNRAVYADRYGTPNFRAEDMQRVIDLTSDIIQQGGYSMDNDYFSLFEVDNENHPEIIFAIKNEVTSPGIGGQSVTRNTTNGLSRGYFLVESRGIRGSDAGCTLPGFLSTWDMDNDPRFFKENYPRETGFIPLEQYRINRGFLMGQQFAAQFDDDGNFIRNDEGLIAIDTIRSTRDNTLANHSPEVNLIAINQSTGVRVAKWDIDLENENRNDTGVDIPIFRLAEMYLVRAEAYLRSGNTASGLADINAVREARGGADFTLSSADLGDVLLERGFEFYWEYHRRTDQVRFGTWEESWTDKTGADVNRRVFPIPPASLQVTPGLEQNPGY
ncbi:MAG: RagB/SusD family nutrient uptake outer membrane protein [Cytophagales bacterium]|nr:RagB/SusD family nutrient uptake outer membrane protein [Cytophagales bacterium]